MEHHYGGGGKISVIRTINPAGTPTYSRDTGKAKYTSAIVTLPALAMIDAGMQIGDWYRVIAENKRILVRKVEGVEEKVEGIRQIRKKSNTNTGTVLLTKGELVLAGMHPKDKVRVDAEGSGTVVLSLLSPDKEERYLDMIGTKRK